MEEKEGQEKPKRKYSKFNKIESRAYSRQASKTFKKLKGLSVVEYLILAGKIQGKSDKEIAKELDCHEVTVTRHRRELQRNSSYFQDIVLKVLDLSDLAVESMRVLLVKADAFATVNYLKGIGIFTDKHVIQHKADPATQQKKFLDRVKGTLNLSPGAKEQLQDAGVEIEKKQEETSEE